MRANEILGLKWSEIDLERKEIRPPAARTKEARDKTMPLNSFATASLTERQAECGRARRLASITFTYRTYATPLPRAC